jgi:hypothetical protein
MVMPTNRLQRFDDRFCPNLFVSTRGEQNVAASATVVSSVQVFGSCVISSSTFMVASLTRLSLHVLLLLFASRNQLLPKPSSGRKASAMPSCENRLFTGLDVSAAAAPGEKHAGWRKFLVRRIEHQRR